MTMASSRGSSTIKFLCSYGGRLVPRHTDGKLRYLGGETRVLTVCRFLPFSDLKLLLGKLCGSDTVILRCQLPIKDLDDVLINVSSDEDLTNIYEEYDHHDSSKVRTFLFPPAKISSQNHGKRPSAIDLSPSKRIQLMEKFPPDVASPQSSSWIVASSSKSVSPEPLEIMQTPLRRGGSIELLQLMQRPLRRGGSLELLAHEIPSYSKPKIAAHAASTDSIESLHSYSSGDRSEISPELLQLMQSPLRRGSSLELLAREIPSYSLPKIVALATSTCSFESLHSYSSGDLSKISPEVLQLMQRPLRRGSSLELLAREIPSYPQPKIAALATSTGSFESLHSYSSGDRSEVSLELLQLMQRPLRRDSSERQLLGMSGLNSPVRGPPERAAASVGTLGGTYSSFSGLSEVSLQQLPPKGKQLRLPMLAALH